MILLRFWWILLFPLILLAAGTTFSQESRKVKQAKKKAGKVKEEQLTMAQKARNDKLERHFNIQTKEVQKRLKNSTRKTEKHYKKVNRRKAIQAFFSKPRKKYGR